MTDEQWREDYSWHTASLPLPHVATDIGLMVWRQYLTDDNRAALRELNATFMGFAEADAMREVPNPEGIDVNAAIEDSVARARDRLFDECTPDQREALARFVSGLIELVESRATAAAIALVALEDAWRDDWGVLGPRLEPLHIYDDPDPPAPDGTRRARRRIQ